MSNVSLKSVFAAFVGDREARVALVCDALVRAVLVTGQHGTYAPLADALSAVATIKGQARAVLALREGIAATGLTVSATGKVSGKGLSVGKMTADAAQVYADNVGEAFTLAASTVLTASVEKVKPTDAERAGKAMGVLSSLALGDLRKALRTTEGAHLLAQIALAQLPSKAPAPVTTPAAVPAADVGAALVGTMVDALTTK